MSDRGLLEGKDNKAADFGEGTRLNKALEGLRVASLLLSKGVARSTERRPVLS